MRVLLYWGCYWREVYHSWPLIAAQLLFAYAFDSLLSWSRRRTLPLGFGPFPIIFSINLFFWFKADWFYCSSRWWRSAFSPRSSSAGKGRRETRTSSTPRHSRCRAVFAAADPDRSRTTWGSEMAQTILPAPVYSSAIFLFACPGSFCSASPR